MSAIPISFILTLSRLLKLVHIPDAQLQLNQYWSTSTESNQTPEPTSTFSSTSKLSTCCHQRIQGTAFAQQSNQEGDMHV